VTTLAGHIVNFDADGDPIGGFIEGNGLEAMFNLPKGLVLIDGLLVVADSGNHMIRTVSETGAVTVIAGTGEPGDIEGPATEALFNAPSGIAYSNGILYIVDTENNKIKSMPF
jgi:hypothetical protein